MALESSSLYDEDQSDTVPTSSNSFAAGCNDHSDNFDAPLASSNSDSLEDSYLMTTFLSISPSERVHLVAKLSTSNPVISRHHSKPVTMASPRSSPPRPDHSALIRRITKLDPGEWVSAGKAAFEAKQAKDPVTAQHLKEQLIIAFEAAHNKRQRIAKILNKNPDLDPDSVAFDIFRIERIAKLLQERVSYSISGSDAPLR